MEKLIFELVIGFDDVHTMKASEGNTVTMINFHGTIESDIFKGKVLSGGVDTQVVKNGKGGLSARYMLEGVDEDGKACKIFIENNGDFPADPKDELRTKPMFMTDSEKLKWLETDDAVFGRINGRGDAVVISFWKEW